MGSGGEGRGGGTRQAGGGLAACSNQAPSGWTLLTEPGSLSLHSMSVPRVPSVCQVHFWALGTQLGTIRQKCRGWGVYGEHPSQTDWQRAGGQRGLGDIKCQAAGGLIPPLTVSGSPTTQDPTYPPCWFTAPAKALPEPHGRMPTGVFTASSQSGRSRNPFSTWRAGDQTPGSRGQANPAPQGSSRMPPPYLKQQPVSGDRDNAVPLTQPQPLNQLPGVVLSF